MLCGFYNRLPISHTDDDDNLYGSSESYTLEDTIDVYGDNDYYADKYEPHEEEDDDDLSHPVIMSDFELLHNDDSVTRKGYLFLSRSSFRNNHGYQPPLLFRNEVRELHHI